MYVVANSLMLLADAGFSSAGLDHRRPIKPTRAWVLCKRGPLNVSTTSYKVVKSNRGVNFIK